MKALLLTLSLALAVSFTSLAQIQRGTRMIGGNGYVNFTEGISLHLNPSLGFLLTDHWALGSGLPIGFHHRTSSRSVSTSIHPFARYFFGQPSRTRVFAQANVMVGHIFFNSKLYGRENHSLRAVGAGLGAVRMISEQVGVEGQLQYMSNGFQNIPRSGNLAMVFGLQVYLPSGSR